MGKLFLCERIFIDDKFMNGGIVSDENGKIKTILRSQREVDLWLDSNEAEEIHNFGNLVLMPGLIDSHVHINEPGRKEWEGFETATKAAAAGGFTTIVDMPLNSIPPTTTVEHLNVKRNVARGKCYIDVAFWGGVIPGNENKLLPMVDQGVVGFKCFLCPSGVPEFPNVNAQQVELAFQKLQNSEAVFAFHAEVCPLSDIPVDESQPKKYETYLKTRPPSMEVEAIKLVTDLSTRYNVRTHIVHLSASEAIPIIRDSRSKNARLTVETCHHYLSLSAEEVPDEHTEYKCAPPIRDQENRERLWQGILDGDINLVVSDHSPSTPNVKMLTCGQNHGDFLKAWGGISSVQFGLPLFWTNCKKYGLGLKDLHRLMCSAPATLCGLDDQKGKLAINYDADFCVWDPEADITITPNVVKFQNKANPYMGKTLKGLVHSTFVRGHNVYQEDVEFQLPLGKLIRKNAIKKN